jgi:HPr kinase/phosphorylase
MMNGEAFLKQFGQELGLRLIAGHSGLSRKIESPNVESPGLALAGYCKDGLGKRIVIFGKQEMSYLKELHPTVRWERLTSLLRSKIPLAILAHAQDAVEGMVDLCNALNVPLVRSRLTATKLMHRLLLYLNEHFAPMVCFHGSFVEVFNIGLLIQGDSAIGKSEAALGLIGRGHRLISDDIVKVKKLGRNMLMGFSDPLSSHYMEVRGIGLIDISRLFGIGSVKDKKNLEIVVKLEVWNDSRPYDRAGLEENTIPILNVHIPFHILPVKPERDIVLLLETVALNHALKKKGFHSAREFDRNLQTTIAHKRK